MRQVKNINLNSYAGTAELTYEEAMAVNGGDGFWHDVAEVATITVICFWEFCKTATEFQQSLPPNLKK